MRLASAAAAGIIGTMKTIALATALIAAPATAALVAASTAAALVAASTAAALVAASAAGAAAPAPRVSVPTTAALPQPLPLPYDEHADASAVVAKARAQALAQHKKLLIDLGGNWCPDCRVLAGVMELPQVAPFVAAHFVVAKVDIGRFDKNGQIAAQYGIKKRLDGVPAVLIVDPRTNTLVNDGHLFALADARHMTPQGLADWLAQWA